jgi:predicted GIY-YIG superfamily endonuclease
MPLPPSGRRPRTAPVDSGVMGTVYTVHFSQRIKTTAPPRHWPQHYTGWTETTVQARLAAHAAGAGSVLFRLAIEQGITWEVVSEVRGDRNRERAMKQGSATWRCPVCKAHRMAAEDAGEDYDHGPGARPHGLEESVPAIP